MSLVNDHLQCGLLRALTVDGIGMNAYMQGGRPGSCECGSQNAWPLHEASSGVALLHVLYLQSHLEVDRSWESNAEHTEEMISVSM